MSTTTVKFKPKDRKNNGKMTRINFLPLKHKIQIAIFVTSFIVLLPNLIVLGLYAREAAIITACGSAILIMLAFLVAPSVVMKPVADLAKAAKTLSEELNLPVRDEKNLDAEPTALTDIFDRLVEQIEKREQALLEAKKRSEETIQIVERLAEDTMMANVDLENEIIERMRAEAQLRESEEKYRNLFDFAPDGIMITGKEGELISFNDALMGIFKFDSREEFAKLSAHDFYMYPEKDRPALIKKLYELEHIESHEVLFCDGNNRAFTASLSLRLIMYEGRQRIQSIVRDISRIKRMEAELRNYAENLELMVREKTAELQSANEVLSDTVQTLEETREQLAFSAHSAGMAEIAVSVLHNIGNAINSINVRIHHQDKSLDREDIESLEKIRNLIQSPDFVYSGTDGIDRKEILLKYFTSTIDSLNDAFSDIRTDSDFVKKGLDHLMEIISLQQKYAGVRGFETMEDLNELLGDSMDMMMDSIVKRRISVEPAFDDVPKIFINKNKMIQIFINIIKNAYEAIDMASENEKRIRLETSLRQKKNGEYVKIAISDTGIGVSPEIREKVFRFNFSTKTRGTGFGLHDAANYINAQNGKISLHSGGHGKGTQVVIMLPVKKGESIYEQPDYRDRRSGIDS